MLCAAHLGASFVLATDANEAVVARLRDSLTPFGAEATLLSWERTAALLALVGSARIDTLLMADVVYPSKDPSPLLEAMRLSLTSTSLVAYCAVTCREPTAFRSFDEALRALPVPVEVVCVDTSASDPLYGAAPVHIYRLGAPAAAAPAHDVAATDKTWRLAAARLRLWPSALPDGVRPYHHGWVHRGNETMCAPRARVDRGRVSTADATARASARTCELTAAARRLATRRRLRQLLRARRPKVVVEVGCWLGLCTQLLLEASTHEAYSDAAAVASAGSLPASEGAPSSGGAAVFAIDRWDADFLLREQHAQCAAATDRAPMSARAPTVRAAA